MPVTPGAGIHPDLIGDTEVVESGQGTHPDLTESGGTPATGKAEIAPQSTPETPKEQATDTQPADDTGARNTPEDAAGETPAAPPETPSWLESLRDIKDPKEALAVLTANLPKEELARDRVLAGLIGDLGQRKAKEAIAALEAQQREQQKAQAVERGDYYTLGELAAPEVLTRLQQTANQRSMEPFMKALSDFQASLPPEVQADVADRDWNMADYMKAIHESAVKHSLEGAVEREIKKREPSLRKQVLSAAYADELSPELANGTAKATREVTSEQVEGMSLDEYAQYFDDFGNPKEGVKYVITRGEVFRAR